MAITDISVLGNITIEFSEPILNLDQINELVKSTNGRRLSQSQPEIELFNLTSLKSLDVIDVVYSTHALDANDQPISKMLDWNVVDFNSTAMVIQADFEDPLLVSSAETDDLITVKIKQP